MIAGTTFRVTARMGSDGQLSQLSARTECYWSRVLRLDDESELLRGAARLSRGAEVAVLGARAGALALDGGALRGAMLRWLICGRLTDERAAASLRPGLERKVRFDGAGLAAGGAAVRLLAERSVIIVRSLPALSAARERVACLVPELPDELTDGRERLAALSPSLFVWVFRSRERKRIASSPSRRSASRVVPLRSRSRAAGFTEPPLRFRCASTAALFLSRVRKRIVSLSGFPRFALRTRSAGFAGIRSRASALLRLLSRLEAKPSRTLIARLLSATSPARKPARSLDARRAFRSGTR